MQAKEEAVKKAKLKQKAEKKKPPPKGTSVSASNYFYETVLFIHPFSSVVISMSINRRKVVTLLSGCKTFRKEDIICC